MQSIARTQLFEILGEVPGCVDRETGAHGFARGDPVLNITRIAGQHQIKVIFRDMLTNCSLCIERLDKQSLQEWIGNIHRRLNAISQIGIVNEIADFSSIQFQVQNILL